MEGLIRAKTRAHSAKVKSPQPPVIVSALWLPGPIKPAAAWRLLAILKTALGGKMAPVAFRTESGLAHRRLTQRANAVVVERLSTGGPVEVLRRAGQVPRVVLRSTATSRGAMLTFYGPRLSSLPEVMAFVDFIKQLYDVLHPIAGVVNLVGDTERRSRGVWTAELAAAVVAKVDQPPPAWLTILGPKRVERVGAARLLMAPVFLIEMLPDGGLLVAETPLPQEVDHSAVRRSTVLPTQLRGGGAGPSGASLPLEHVGLSDLASRGMARPSRVSEP